MGGGYEVFGQGMTHVVVHSVEVGVVLDVIRVPATISNTFKNSNPDFIPQNTVRFFFKEL